MDIKSLMIGFKYTGYLCKCLDEVIKLRESIKEGLKQQKAIFGYYYHAGKTWEDVKLWEATKDNKVFDVQVDTFIKADTYWNIGTFKDFVEEMKIMLKADYSYPIIIDECNKLVDGAHRIVHAYLDGKTSIKAVIIGKDQWPEPDYDEVKACEEKNKKDEHL